MATTILVFFHKVLIRALEWRDDQWEGRFEGLVCMHRRVVPKTGSDVRIQGHRPWVRASLRTVSCLPRVNYMGPGQCVDPVSAGDCVLSQNPPDRCRARMLIHRPMIYFASKSNSSIT